jgi:hypothetical protein
MTNDSYQMYDLKGQGVIGEMSNETYTLGLGGIYGELGTGESGGGIVVEPVVLIDEGPVILQITREADTPGSAIRISWTINTTEYPELLPTAAVDIYALEGDGSGQYVNGGAGWFQVLGGAGVTDAGVARLVSMGVDGVFRSIRVDNQVGTAPNEIYFKGVIRGRPEPLAHATWGLPGAAAVGKVNVPLQGTPANPGKNIVSIPLYPKIDRSVSAVFGQEIWLDEELIQYKYTGSPAYSSAKFLGGQWQNAARSGTPPAFEFDPRQGYEIIVRGDKVFSAVGGVINTSEAVVEIYNGRGLSTGGKTLLGMYYPLNFSLTGGSNLLVSGAGENDLIQYKTSPFSPAYISAKVVDGRWINAANAGADLPAVISNLRLPYGYTFVRYGDAGFTWRRARPF